uniref:Uncharacterized protein n=1 Tax=Chromera velia CCMP2878 TaxID=1169474 RepID=A0A0G4F3M7_9ALVE|eukprot:Cvel_14842.t1-p1 / transcript=Cvel_14842.t1 / gene=Cvel_14842 / organism=Chromera_velia_CCMP2878 / gene_product=hypothetical protein / transcript_product=hypothetical protein / location=Cvel_scaffold1072:16824-21660(+) / protein_length=807 / sequence_SO=supercontig / SO=protein_coding / is_pseudo=false
MDDKHSVKATGEEAEKVAVSDLKSWDGIFCKFLKTKTPSAEALSQMASGRDGYAAACLCLYAIKRGKVVGVSCPSLDISKCTLSPRRTFFLLDLLPLSAEELKLGPSAVKEQALPLLRRFLERVQGDGGENGEPAIKHLGFADTTVGPRAAPVIFSALPSSLESLSLQGNELGREEIERLAEAARAGRVSCVRTLNLNETGVDDEGMQILSSAFVEVKPLKIERLLLQGGAFVKGPTLFSLLRGDTLPILKELQLDECQMSPGSLTALAQRVKGGELRSLENLGFEGILETDDDGEDEYQEVVLDFDAALVAFARALDRASVPLLKHLNLRGVWVSGEAADALIAALRSDEAPPLETAELEIHWCTEESSRQLGSGDGLKFIHRLEIDIEGESGLAFLNGVLSGPEKPSWKALALNVSNEGERTVDLAIWTALADALGKGRLSALESFLAQGDNNADEEEGVEGFQLPPSSHESEGQEQRGSEFCKVFRSLNFLILSQLRLPDVGLTDQDLVWLGEGVKEGNYPQLSELHLGGNPEFGRVGMEGLFGGVRESEKGLPHLFVLNLSNCTKAGEGAASLGAALRCGKMSGLARLSLRYAGWDDVGMGVLGEAVRERNLSHVWQFLLGGNAFGREGMDAFFGSVCASEEGWPSLHYMELAEGRAGDGIAALSQSLRLEKMPHISDIELSSCRLTNEGMRVLGEVFGEKATPSLTELDLSGNPFNEEGLTSFLEALQPQSLPNLNRLALRGEWAAPWKKELIMKAKEGGKLSSLDESSIRDDAWEDDEGLEDGEDEDVDADDDEWEDEDDE